MPISLGLEARMQNVTLVLRLQVCRDAPTDLTRNHPWT
jgi:hypothetical protein